MTASDIFAAYDAALITKGERDELLTALGTFLSITRTRGNFNPTTTGH